jgi:hypothetical protein
MQPLKTVEEVKKEFYEFTNNKEWDMDKCWFWVVRKMNELIANEANRAETLVMPKIAEGCIYTIEQQLAMALGTIEQQKQVLKEVAKVIKEAPELNMGNYTEDEVKELNDKMIEAFGILNESNFSA